MLKINTENIRQTIIALQEAGVDEKEGLVFWLGKSQLHAVHSVFQPIFNSSRDHFEIEQIEMLRIVRLLRKDNLRIVAQVHSHPAIAFHSPADDKWAIARHNGALSIVLPYFCKKITLDTFSESAAIYECQNDLWIESEFYKKIEVACAHI